MNNEETKAIAVSLLYLGVIGEPSDFDVLPEEYKEAYFKRLEQLKTSILQQYSNTLFTVDDKGQVTVIINRKQVEELYKELNCWDSAKPYELLTAVKSLNKIREWQYGITGYESILKNIANQKEGSTYNHSQVKAFARAMLLLLRHSPNIYHEAEIKVLLQSMSLTGLSHFDRSVLAKEILALLKDGKDWEERDRNRNLEDDWI